jgi:hypothetical protein
MPRDNRSVHAKDRKISTCSSTGGLRLMGKGCSTQNAMESLQSKGGGCISAVSKCAYFSHRDHATSYSDVSSSIVEVRRINICAVSRM